MRLNLKPVYLGRIFGVPIRAHYSWLPVVPFYTWAISKAYLPNQVSGLPEWEYWSLGFATTMLLFLSVLVHEIAHSVMARAEGIGTQSITLYMFGGLAALERNPALPSSEFKIAVVGPAASFLVGTLFFGSAMLLQSIHRPSAQVLRHLGIVNWFLAGFNILPGLPLDGGRVLRAILWRFSKNFGSATRVALRAGLTISLALLAGGLYFLRMGNEGYITGVWSIAVGAMLLLLTTSGVTAHAKLTALEQSMSRGIALVPPETTINDFIDRYLRKNQHVGFPVGAEGRLYGMLMLKELKQIPQDRWSRIKVVEVMRPVDDSMFIASTASPAEAEEKARKNESGSVIVVNNDGLVVGSIGAEGSRMPIKQ